MYSSSSGHRPSWALPRLNRERFRSGEVHNCYLVKYVVPEEFEHISIAIFCPSHVPVELSTVYHGTQLCQQPEKSGRLHLLGQLRLYEVILSVGRVQLSIKAGTWSTKKYCWICFKVCCILQRSPIIGIRSFTLLTLAGFVSRYMMRFRRSLLYVELTISIDVWRFSRWIARQELQARAEKIISQLHP